MLVVLIAKLRVVSHALLAKTPKFVQVSQVKLSTVSWLSLPDRGAVCAALDTILLPVISMSSHPRNAMKSYLICAKTCHVVDDGDVKGNISR